MHINSSNGPTGIRSIILLTAAFAAASIGCTCVLVLRIMVVKSYRYMYLVWNLFLAWVPYALALCMVFFASRIRNRRKLKLCIILVGIFWFLFYPNAPYILTDFIHLIKVQPLISDRISFITNDGILWYDIVLNSSFAFIGHLIGLVSLVFFHDLTRVLYNRWVGWVIAIFATISGGYGIYLGRFARLNSWHLFTKPVPSLKMIIENLFNTKALLFSLSFGFFIFLTYIVVYSFRKSKFIK
jgi:uncharacterized membrane protein